MLSLFNAPTSVVKVRQQRLMERDSRSMTSHNLANGFCQVTVSFEYKSQKQPNSLVFLCQGREPMCQKQSLQIGAADKTQV